MIADEQAIRDVIAEWHRATAAGDVDRVLDFMADDVVFLVAGQPPMTGRAKFEAGLRALLKSHRLESAGDVREVSVSGELAYALTHLSVRLQPLAGGEPRARAGFSLSIFRKFADGKWRMIRDANLLPAPGDNA